ncbi:MAG: fused MFS/spermidine synthase, partial [Candidatus Pacearchaeota archaeon]|nr:fused MFS/spermidine synthase [Candidatus Pacearchaeota archaeon]
MLVNHKKILLGFAFFSGFAALLYEIIWLREMHLIFGVSFYALSTVFSAFLGGLVLGSYFSGRFIDKFTSLKKIAGIYGFVELFIGVGALMVPLLLDGLTPSLSFFHNLNINLFMFNFIRFILAGFVLLIPTFFIGATFPIILRLYTETRGEIKEGISLLYFINTLGGVFGVIIAGFFLIRFFGMRFTLYLGVLINLIIMGFAFRISKNYGEEKIEDYGVPDSDKEEYSKKIKFVLFLFFISGFTALAYEVIWGRLLVLYLYGTTYAASALLIIFLLGISLGSLIYSRFFKNTNLKHFAYLEIVIAFFSVLGLYIYPIFPKVQVLGFGTSFGVLFLITSVLIFIPTLCFGIVFPLISEYVLRRSNKIGSS